MSLRAKKARSDIWKYFIKENSLSARCVLCTKLLKHGGNTTNLHNHFKNVHKLHVGTKSPPKESTLLKEKMLTTDVTNKENRNELNEATCSTFSFNRLLHRQKQPLDNSLETEKEFLDNSLDINIDDPIMYEQNMVTDSESQNTFPTVRLSSFEGSKLQNECKTKLKETKITEMFTRMNSFKDGSSLANKLTNCIMYMIASENLPLSIVDSKAFKRLMNTVLYKIPSRRTITRLIDAKYEILKETFKEDLKLGCSYTLTCDIWTDVSNQSYLGVTIHYLHELVLTNATIGVFPLMQNHTANYIREKIVSIIESFGINLSSITAIVTDSAANMVKAITDEFGSVKHLACVAHALSHIVPDSIKLNPRIEEIIGKVKSIVTVTKRSVVASDELKRLQIRDGKTDSTALKFKQDVPTRWNSTYYMIKRFLELKDYVYPVLLMCPMAPKVLSREEIAILEDVVQVLGPIEFVTTEISGDLYPTSSMVIPVIHCMEGTVKNCITSTVEGNSFKTIILSQIQQRFKEIESHHILAISTILDPRYKRMHFQSRAVSAAVSYINKQLKAINSNNIMSLTKDQSNTQTESKTEFNVWAFHDNLIESCTSSVDEPGGLNLELRQYLNQSPIPRSMDPFKHWQILKPAYPMLFIVAMQYLSVVATSVPSERMFSKTGIIKSNLRSRLSGKRLNILLFLGSLSEETWGFK